MRCLATDVSASRATAPHTLLLLQGRLRQTFPERNRQQPGLLTLPVGVLQNLMASVHRGVTQHTSRALMCGINNPCWGLISIKGYR